MYKSDNLKQTDNETFTYIIDKHKDFKILQLTDLHLGFGFISRKKDKLALNAVTKIIHKAKPDMIVLTGDSIFPFLPKAGTLNNRKQAYKLMKFMDSLLILPAQMKMFYCHLLCLILICMVKEAGFTADLTGYMMIRWSGA